MLPQEDYVRRHIETAHRASLELLSDAISTGIALFGAGPDGKRTLSGTDGRGLTPTTLHLVLGLWAKATKQARSILMLSERGMVEDADTLVRCLFETALTVEFIIRRRVSLKTGKRKIVTGKGKGLKPLTIPIRSAMHGAGYLVE